MAKTAKSFRWIDKIAKTRPRIILGRALFQKLIRLLLWCLDHSLKRNKCWWRLAVARRQVAIEIETTLAGRSGVTSRTTRNTKRNCVRGRSSAVGRVNGLYERVGFNEDLVATLNVSVSCVQIEDFTGRGVGASGKNGIVQAAFCIDSLAREAQLDVFWKSSTTSHVWASPCQIEGRRTFVMWVDSSLQQRGCCRIASKKIAAEDY